MTTYYVLEELVPSKLGYSWGLILQNRQPVTLEALASDLSKKLANLGGFTYRIVPKYKDVDKYNVKLYNKLN